MLQDKKENTVDYDRTLAFVNRACEIGVFQLSTDAQNYDGRSVQVKGKILRHFANCSYIGLDVAEELKAGAIDAIQRYGNLFSSSRLSIGLGLNEELEALLDQMTGQQTLVTQSTSLGSLSAIPVLTNAQDLIIVDRQVHASVRNAVRIAETQGTPVLTVAHNDVNALEYLIRLNQNKYRNIWYMADGIYSMLGDACPVDALHDLMNIYSSFHCFVDDAHGISWAGQHGRGTVLAKRALHPNMVLAMSMAKGFGASGGMLVFTDKKTRHAIRSLGSSLIFSGPIPTPVLGACIASAKLHLSDAIELRQAALQLRIHHLKETARELKLPLIRHGFSPIFFFGAGNEENAFHIAGALVQAGFLTTVCSYPIVSKKNAGVRVTLTTHNQFEDIDALLITLREIISDLEVQGKFSMEQVSEAFSLNPHETEFCESSLN